MLRPLALADMGAAAQVHRIAFDQAMPWLTGLHTPEEDRWFYRERVFPTCRVWGRFDGDELGGIIAFRDGWIEQLYVRPGVRAAASARHCSTSPKPPASGSSSGPSSATHRAGASMKRAGSGWPRRPTERGTRRRSRTSGTFGDAGHLIRS
ncbi:hypothetical protein ABID58_002358 [Bradyrhizobium sp. S3.2.6]